MRTPEALRALGSKMTSVTIENGRSVSLPVA